MQATDTMFALILRAETGELSCINEARNVLANALVNGQFVDENQLEQFIVRIGKRGRGNALAWSPLITACADYLEHKMVAMADGRCVTQNGWNYENMPNRGKTR